MKDNPLIKIQTAQEIIIKNIPIVQELNGPILTGLDRIRENKYLKHFRRKISDSIYEIDAQDSTDLVQQIESEFQKYGNEVLLKYHSDATIIQSSAKAIASLIVGAIAPGFQELKELGEKTEVRQMNWAAFLASLKSSNISGK